MSFFANRHYNLAYIQSELEYLQDNPELLEDTKSQLNNIANQLEVIFNTLEDIDRVMTNRMTEDQFLDKYKKVRI
jgi:prefoldin subunit 5